MHDDKGKEKKRNNTDYNFMVSKERRPRKSPRGGVCGKPEWQFKEISVIPIIISKKKKKQTAHKESVKGSEGFVLRKKKSFSGRVGGKPEESRTETLTSTTAVNTKRVSKNSEKSGKRLTSQGLLYTVIGRKTAASSGFSKPSNVSKKGDVLEKTPLRSTHVKRKMNKGEISSARHQAEYSGT